MRSPVYVIPDRPWWADAIAAALGVLPMLAALLVALLFAGCGDDVEYVPPVCVPASGATTDLCGDSVIIAGTDYPLAGCTGFVANDGCTVPELLAKPDAHGRVLVDVLCVSHCGGSR